MATALIERKGDRLYHLTAPLTTDNTVTGHLARQLLPLLVHDPILAQRAKELDRREMDLGQLRPRYDPPRHSGDLAPIRNLAPWVLMALALLLFLERWISKIRQQ